MFDLITITVIEIDPDATSVTGRLVSHKIIIIIRRHIVMYAE